MARLLLIAAVILFGCTPWRSSYLADVVNHATQDEITQRLGPPDVSRTLDNGGAVWRYRYYESYFSGRRGSISGGSNCFEYILTFDAQKVLRDWVQQGC